MEQTEPKTSARGWLIAIGIVLCCICIMAISFGGYLYYSLGSHNLFESESLPTNEENNVTLPQPTVPVVRTRGGAISNETLVTLQQDVVSYNDLYDLACRLKAVCDVPHTLPAPSTPLQVGARQKFWVSNVETDQNFQITATLMYITAHAYFWSQDNAEVNQSDMKKLMDTFESRIYPTDREFFGSEWTPGVDNDPHIYILYARGTGTSNAGYFSSPNEYNPLVFKYSNGHEMFIFNADNSSLSDQYTFSVLAHEFQHMIHWNSDRNEATWLNEGSSVLAEFINGYPPYFDQMYVASPDLNLTDWLPDPANNGPHYGEAFLFLDYFLDRFGDKATQALVRDQEHSLPSVDDTLKNLNIIDPQTGKVITADDVVMDWMIAMYLKDGSVGDGRYTYHNYPDVPQTHDTTTFTECPQAPINLSVNQYGAEYIDIACAGNHTLSFTGSTEVNLLPTQPHSGNTMFWSNQADESDMTLTHDFDFTNVTAPIQMTYWAWYDLEKGYDYAYLEASTDGQHWDILHTPSCSNQDTSGNAYGCGYTGKSGRADTAQWLNETVDLSSYAGRKIQLRFEYVTDPAVNLNGLALDDISIPAINYTSDFETDDGGWQAKGFTRVGNELPQTFRLALIVKGGGKTTVQNIALTSDQTADIPLSLKPGQNAELVVTGTERFTRLRAGFTLEIK